MTQPPGFELPSLELAQHTWVLQDEHSPASQPPLLASVDMFAALGGPKNPNEPLVRLTINGYNYQREGANSFGAAVTNSGGVLSHWAIVAREFGIPAVVGTKHGTETIRDGAAVTVDGTSGLVVIEA